VNGSALVHGFQIGFYALAAGAAVGAVLAAVVIESPPARAESEPGVDAPVSPKRPCASSSIPVLKSRSV
jgi:hypothetical protein